MTKNREHINKWNVTNKTDNPGLQSSLTVEGVSANHALRILSAKEDHLVDCKRMSFMDRPRKESERGEHEWE